MTQKISINYSDIRNKVRNNETILSLKYGETYEIMISTMMPSQGFIELGDLHFSYNSAVFLPNESSMHKPEERTDAFSSGIVILERTYHLLKTSDLKLFIAGHTDTIGDPEQNRVLSEHRAASMYALLIGDRELFKTSSDAPYIEDKEKKHTTLLNDKIHISNWASAEFDWPCSFEKNSNDYLRTFKAFQKSYNDHNFAENPNGQKLDVDGDWGLNTWGAVFDCYELKLAQRLTILRSALPNYRDTLSIKDRLLFPSKPYFGCGEYHPIENNNKDNFYSKTNRRVELYFSNSTEIIEPQCASSGTCKGKDCEFYTTAENFRDSVIVPEWEFPLVFAGFTECRTMKITSPGLKDGETIFFSVFQIADGEVKEIISNLSAKVTGTSAEIVFQEWSDDVIKQLPESEDGSFFSYFFKVKSYTIQNVSSRLHSYKDGAIHI